MFNDYFPIKYGLFKTLKINSASKMSKNNLYTSLTIFISLIWICNGLFCKILNLVPRHQEIVANILGEPNARLFTMLIGIGEVILGILILSRFKTKLLAIAQICLVATMNIIEFSQVPELLLWGKVNFMFAMGFLALVYYHEFVLRKQLT